jgi:hypothetical protein
MQIFVESIVLLQLVSEDGDYLSKIMISSMKYMFSVNLTLQRVSFRRYSQLLVRTYSLLMSLSLLEISFI